MQDDIHKLCYGSINPGDFLNELTQRRDELTEMMRCQSAEKYQLEQKMKGLAAKIDCMRMEKDNDDKLFLFWRFTSLASDLVLADNETTYWDSLKTYNFTPELEQRLSLLLSNRPKDYHPFLNSNFLGDKAKIERLIAITRNEDLITSEFLMNDMSCWM